MSTIPNLELKIETKWEIMLSLVVEPVALIYGLWEHRFGSGLQIQTQAQSLHGQHQARHQHKAPLSIWATPSGEASTGNDVEERGRGGGAETVELHGFRSHGTNRWTSPQMAPSTTPQEQAKRTVSRPPSTA
ncbi:hypothetical protein VitviT2T_017217 [Vitis vinifera]|uniref:Uncharacterized protein n=1 Tax=Vitis vinifera TaxID=29760 RepID=A0ABY9CVQ5_VITVI|nr:hypothetical protein VitviT2T_017217 [Vitis vinifera]